MATQALYDYIAGDFRDRLLDYERGGGGREWDTDVARLACAGRGLPSGYGDLYDAPKLVPFSIREGPPLCGEALENFRVAVAEAMRAGIPPVGDADFDRRPGADRRAGFGAIAVPSPEGAAFPGFRDPAFDSAPSEVPNLGECRFLGDRAGWLLLVLRQEESLVNGRWAHLKRVHQVGVGAAGDIPRIDFVGCDAGCVEIPVAHDRAIAVRDDNYLVDVWSNEVYKYLDEILALIDPEWDVFQGRARAAIAYFFDWLLWGLGHRIEFPEEPQYRPEDIVPEPGTWDGFAHNRLIRAFGLAPLLAFPNPLYLHYLADMAQANEEDPGIPAIDEDAAATAVEALYGEDPTASFIDPDCSLTLDVATAIASNHTTNLAIASGDEMHLKASVINAYLYWPSAIYPLKGRDIDPDFGLRWWGELPWMGDLASAGRYVPAENASALAPMGLYRPAPDIAEPEPRRPDIVWGESEPQRPDIVWGESEPQRPDIVWGESPPQRQTDGAFPSPRQTSAALPPAQTPGVNFEVQIRQEQEEAIEIERHD